jgi:hypothetical protein
MATKQTKQTITTNSDTSSLDKTISLDKLSTDSTLNDYKIQEFETIITECKDIVQTFTDKILLMEDSKYIITQSDQKH